MLQPFFAQGTGRGAFSAVELTSETAIDFVEGVIFAGGRGSINALVRLHDLG